MENTKFDINSIRVAMPCSAGWETMSGDERVRHCGSCKLNVYNITEMTEREVQLLIERRESRLCIRLHRRADGTVITRDCPTGLRNYRKRLARSVGATLSLILGLISTTFAQKSDSYAIKRNSAESIRISKTVVKTGVEGVITDHAGAVIPGVSVSIYKQKKVNVSKTRSDADGYYAFPEMAEGTYILELNAPGFKKSIIANIKVQSGLVSVVNVRLEVAGESVVVGIFSEEPLIDMRSSTVQTTITFRMINSLPRN